MLNDPARLTALLETGLMDGEPQPGLDRLARIGQRAVRAPVVLLSLVDSCRQFFSSHFGLPAPWAQQRQTPLSHSFCQHVVTSGEPLIVGDAARDDRVCTNLAITDLGVVAYAGFPIRCDDGLVLGSFCAIDVEQRVWRPDELEMLAEIAAAMSAEMDARRSLNRNRVANENLQKLSAELLEDRERVSSDTASFRHDLRSPLQVVGLGIHALLQHPLATQSPEINRTLQAMKRNVSHASDILAQLRSRTHPVDPAAQDAPRMDRVVTEVVDSLREYCGTTELTIGRSEETPVRCEATDLRRCVENLVTNAIRFARSRIEISVVRRGDRGVLVVLDDGPGLPHPAAYAEVWGPGVRFHQEDGRSGTGLGLNITMLIVEQAGGDVHAAQGPLGGASFTISLPLADA